MWIVHNAVRQVDINLVRIKFYDAFIVQQADPERLHRVAVCY